MGALLDALRERTNAAWRRVAALLWRRQLDRDLDDELAYHQELRRARQREGLPERARFGNATSIRETCREVWSFPMLESLWRDARHAFRQMRRTPGVTLVAVLSMALGIGATAAVYSVVHAVLIDTHPYRDADRIVHYMDLGSAATFEQWRELDAFEDMIATDVYGMNVTRGDLPENVLVGRVSANAFEFFGVPPALGRTFGSGEDTEPVAVLTYGFWQRYFGGDPRAIGETIRLDGEVYTVIGVVPPRFRWKSAEMFIPADLPFYQTPSLELAGRLKPGATREQAEAQALAEIRQRVPTLPGDYRVRFQDLRERATRGVSDTLVLFLVAVFVLLAVACANVSILLLARGAARQHEMALRAAIGASRRRLAGQVVTEALLLTCGGGLLGVGLAYAGLNAILGWLPPQTLPPESDVRVNLPVLALSVAVAMLTGLAAGSAPAVHFSRPRLSELMQAAASRATGTLKAKRAQYALVAAQVALTVVLLAGAGAAIRALLTLYSTDLGYDPSHIVRVTVPTPEGAYPEWEQRKALFQAISREASELPRVEFAAFGPFSPPFYGSNRPVEIPGQPGDPQRRVLLQNVSSQYFDVLRIPLLEGRFWSEFETGRAAQVAVVNQAMAERYWPAGNAIGHTLRFPTLGPTQWIVTPEWSTEPLEIVGVVGDVINRGLHEEPGPAVYVPYTLNIGDNLALIVRTPDGLRIVDELRQRVNAVADGQAIANIATGEDILREIGWQQEEVVSTLFAIFAGLALALAAIGLYSAVAYTTVLRRQEFGIRMALGARNGDVIRLVLRPASIAVPAGILIGLAASLASNRLLASWTSVSVYDPWVLASIVVVLLAMAAAAVLLPAMRAARTDPAAVLRE